jgi:membrane fusion protein, copper/silver efflux system
MRRLLVVAIGIVIFLALVGGTWYWRTKSSRGVEQDLTLGPPAGTSTAPAAGVARGDVTIDARRQQLIGVRTVAVRRGTLNDVVRAVGTIRYDETRLTDVNLKIDGWIRDLYVDYTGQPITNGQRLFSIYSPEFRTTASEYVLALKTRDSLRDSIVPEARLRADDLVAAARARLALWDVSSETIRELEEKRVVPETIEFRAPASGVVLEKTAVSGLHVTAGQSLYKIVNLSVVWVEADLHEQELGAARVGRSAKVTFDAYPGSQFSARVVYVYPYLNEETRTNRVRFELPNPDGRLRPGMFANVELQASAGTGLTIPTDALLDSGAEQIVFVALGDGRFEPRRVKAGRRLGGEVQILEGLKEGEQVAAGAAFFLDSESQLRGALAGYEASPATPGVPPTSLVISLQTDPSPPRTGENVFVVTVKDRDGKLIADADVAVQLFMPAMPTMNMPAMRSEVKLAPAGAGTYRGTGQILMTGRWEATVIVSKAGRRLGNTQTTLVAR